MLAECHVYLRIADDDCSPEEVTQSIGIQPSNTWLKGDRRGKTLIVEQENGWELKSSLPLELPLIDHMKHLLRVIEPVRDKFSALSAKWNAFFACALYIYDEVPDIHFQREIIKRLGDLNLSLDLDLYSLDEDEDDEKHERRA